VTESSLPAGAATAAKQEASRAILDSLNGKDYSTAAKQDAIAGLVGALDAAAVSDPAAAGAVIALLKGYLVGCKPWKTRLIVLPPEKRL